MRPKTSFSAIPPPPSPSPPPPPPRASATIQYGEPVDGYVDITFGVTAAYIPSKIVCTTYSTVLAQLVYKDDSSPTATVTTIVKPSASVSNMEQYSFGSAAIYVGANLNEVASLSLLNPSPPPPAIFPPPPPSLGTLSGHVAHVGGVFSTSVAFSSQPPDTFNYAYFTAAGTVVSSGSNPPNGNPSTWTDTVSHDMAALMSYVQVVSIQNSGGNSAALTLTW
ncbi:hypothetical protein ACKKBG_A06515 [Auxenochlorella protothecoides x Auxenochlorella symbiontica]